MSKMKKIFSLEDTLGFVDKALINVEQLTELLSTAKVPMSEDDVYRCQLVSEMATEYLRQSKESLVIATMDGSGDEQSENLQSTNP